MNWGKGISIAIVLFMGFILGMVYKASQTHPDLHSEDYYDQEINYQHHINGIHNMQSLSDKVAIVIEGDSIIMSFPEDCMKHDMQGRIHFYRPDNAKLDKHFPMHLNGRHQTFWKGGLVKGKYTVKCEWEMGGKPYMFEQEIDIQ